MPKEQTSGILSSGEETSLFEDREEQVRHVPYRLEEMLIGAIRDGDLAMVEYVFNRINAYQLPLRKLSDNELRQAQYIAVILTYQASRAAIQGGMFESNALKRADDLIRRIDQATSPQEVMKMIGESIFAWTNAMSEAKQLKKVSPPIRACLNYMYDHLTSKISLQELAQVCGLSTPHLSALFKKEVGENYSKYMLRLKIKSAQSMLLDTNYTAKEIGYHLNFSSESHFIRCFKQVTGVTPSAFRKR